MKKKLVLTAAVIAALSVVSCNGKKTNSQGADQDSLSYAENDSLNSNDVILDSIAGTYECFSLTYSAVAIRLLL